jgi:hypothetical protein
MTFHSVIESPEPVRRVIPPKTTWMRSIITPVYIQIATGRKELREEDCIAGVKFYFFIQIASGIP